MAGSPNKQPATAVHCRNVSVRWIMTWKGRVLKVDRFTAVGIMLCVSLGFLKISFLLWTINQTKKLYSTATQTGFKSWVRHTTIYKTAFENFFQVNHCNHFVHLGTVNVLWALFICTHSFVIFISVNFTWTEMASKFSWWERARLNQHTLTVLFQLTPPKEVNPKHYWLRI